MESTISDGGDKKTFAVMMNYLQGKLKNLFNPAVTLLAVVDCRSVISPKAKMYRFTKLVNSTLGKYSYMGSGSWAINADIGSFCSIADQVNIGLARHSLTYLSISPLFTQKKNATGASWTGKKDYTPRRRVVIGHDVWIGSRVLIRDGVMVGNGAVIGAGAVVTKNVPPYAIMGGVPAKVIRYRFSSQIIVWLEELQWWDMEEKQLKKYIHLYQYPTEEKNVVMLLKVKQEVELLNYRFFHSFEERRIA